jgi:hypothetical protein
MEVVDLKEEQTAWFPLAGGADTLYVGQLVAWGADGGVTPAGQAAGAYDTTDNNAIAGIIIGVNDLTQTNDATYNTVSVTAVADGTAQATYNARNWFGQEGMWSKGDSQHLVQVALLDPTTRVKIPVFATAYGTAPALLTVTTGSATGAGMTHNANDVEANTGDEMTYYCRTGANAGLYRVNDLGSNITPGFDKVFPFDIAIGDTFVGIQATTGYCKFQTDAEGIYLENDETLDTNYWGLICEHLDFREAGKEHIVGRFIPRHFGGVD